MTNIVYLDLDGIVVTAKQRAQSPDPDYLPHDTIALIIDLCRKANAKVVVTSTWRRNSNCRDALARAGLPPDYLYPDWRTALDLDPPNDVSVRGFEIADHVARNGITNYVILDDFPVLDCQTKRHVQPDDRIGLLPGHIDDAFRILGRCVQHAAA
jgi:hypothetical protein